MERMSEHTCLISSYQLLITAACTKTGSNLKGSRPRAADWCPFVPRHNLIRFPVVMEGCLVCDNVPSAIVRKWLPYCHDLFWCQLLTHVRTYRNATIDLLLEKYKSCMHKHYTKCGCLWHVALSILLPVGFHRATVNMCEIHIKPKYFNNYRINDIHCSWQILQKFDISYGVPLANI